MNGLARLLRLILILITVAGGCTTARPPLDTRPIYLEDTTLVRERVEVGVRGCDVGCLDWWVFRSAVSEPAGEGIYAIKLTIVNKSDEEIALDRADIQLSVDSVPANPLTVRQVDEMLRGFWARFLDVNWATNTMIPGPGGTVLWAAVRVVLAPITVPSAMIDMHSDTQDLKESAFVFESLPPTQSRTGFVYFMSEVQIYSANVDVTVAPRLPSGRALEFTFTNLEQVQE